MCALDVDAICACKILQNLLESFNLQYSVAPVANTGKLWIAFEEYRNSVDSIVMINFGNSINIPKLLKSSNDIKFYVIDSHRPIDVYNYYKNPQVRLYVNRHEEGLNIPPRKKIFRRDDPLGEEEAEAADGGGYDDDDGLKELEALMAINPRDLSTEQLEKRQKLRRWYGEREKLLFDYEEWHYYNRSVAIVMYDLAFMLSKHNNYLLWMAIVGITYQLKSDKIESKTFEKEASLILRHLKANQVSHRYGNKWTIRWGTDIMLDMYRRWSIYDSLICTPLTACFFKLWNEAGLKNLSDFLVTCGLPLKQAKEKYVAMDYDLRTILIESFSNICIMEHRNQFELPELISRCFTMNYGFNTKLCAHDFVLALRGILESYEPSTTMTEKFVSAIDSLSLNSYELTKLEQGFELARKQLVSMFEQVKIMITTNKIVDEGTYLFVELREDDQLAPDFARGDCLTTFTKFLLRAYVSSIRKKGRASKMPMLLVSVDYYNPQEIIMVGILPLGEQSKRNFFSKAFEMAAEEIGCEITHDLSETHLIRASINHKSDLLDAMKRSLT